MPPRTIVGFFPDERSAEAAYSELLEAGVARHRIVVSRQITKDGIAAEAPGQDFGNESDYHASRGEAGDALFEEEAESAACVISVTSEPRDWERVAEVLQRSGARRTMMRPR